MLIPALRESDAGATLADLVNLSVVSGPREFGGMPWGRPRMRGDWGAAYLAYVMSRYPAVQPWWTHTRSSPLWEACGFERPPSHAEVQLQFERLEERWEAFMTVAQALIRQARDQEPRIGEIVFVDATQWVTSATLEHCCSPDECPNPRQRRPAIGRDQLAALEAHWAEDDGPEPDEDEQCEGTRRDLQWVRGVRGELRAYQRFFVDGCWYRSRDVTSGLRKYTGTRTSWFGGYLQVAVDMLTGAPLAVEVFPADIMEWDHYPQLFASMVAALGEAPYAVSVDRGYSIKKFFEFNTRRDVAVVAPLRERTGRKERVDWRTDAYDEDGVPRCQACGNEGIQNGPGLGLEFRSGEPYIRYRCSAPISDECASTQSIACSSEFVMLLPLPRTSELYHSIAYAHHNMERIFDQLRDRYAVAGKDPTQRLRRAGAGAQRLRASAAMVLEWFRLSVRQGWQESNLLEDTTSPTEPKRLSGEQDPESGEVVSFGVGSERLGALLALRDEASLDVPYGRRWSRMKKRLATGAGT